MRPASSSCLGLLLLGLIIPVRIGVLASLCPGNLDPSRAPCFASFLAFWAAVLLAQAALVHDPRADAAEDLIRLASTFNAAGLCVWLSYSVLRTEGTDHWLRFRAALAEFYLVR